jgi:hypothetical protein
MTIETLSALMGGALGLGVAWLLRGRVQAWRRRRSTVAPPPPANRQQSRKRARQLEKRAQRR